MPGRPSPALRLNGGKRVTLKANSTNPRGRRAAKFVASRSCGHARASERDQPRNQRIRPKSSLHRPPRCIAKGETEDYASSSEGIASSAWAGATGMTSAWLRSPTIHLCSLVPWCQSNCFPAGNGGNGRSPLAENHPRAATLIPFFFPPGHPGPLCLSPPPLLSQRQLFLTRPSSPGNEGSGEREKVAAREG